MAKNKKAAMEMSMGTIVTIILLVVVLVLGIFFVQKIFGTGNKAITQIDDQVQNEINKLFTDEGKRVVLYPDNGEITLKQGDTGGFGISIMNNFKEVNSRTFTYEVFATEENDCGLSKDVADSYIQIGRTYSVDLLSGNAMDRAQIVKFSIPNDAPLCLIRYKVDVRADGEPYTDATMDLQIK